MTLVPPLHHSLPTWMYQPPPSMSHHTSRSPVGSLVVETCLPLSMLNITHPLVPHIVCDLHHTVWSSTFPPVVTVSMKTTTTPTRTTEKVCKVWLNTPHTWHHERSSKRLMTSMSRRLQGWWHANMMTHQGEHMTRWQASWLLKGDDEDSFSDSCGNLFDTSVVDTVNDYVGGPRATCPPMDAPTVSCVGSPLWLKPCFYTVHDESLYSAVTHGPRASLGWLAKGMTTRTSLGNPSSW